MAPVLFLFLMQAMAEALEIEWTKNKTFRKKEWRKTSWAELEDEGQAVRTILPAVRG